MKDEMGVFQNQLWIPFWGVLIVRTKCFGVYAGIPLFWKTTIYRDI